MALPLAMGLWLTGFDIFWPGQTLQPPGGSANVFYVAFIAATNVSSKVPGADGGTLCWV